MSRKKLFLPDPWLARAVVGLTVLGLALDVAAIPVGIAFSNHSDIPGYVSKLNWSLMPAFVATGGVLAYLSWAAYMRAWRTLVVHSVVWRGDAVETDVIALDDFVDLLQRLRTKLALSAVALGLFLTSVDAGCLFSEYLSASAVAVCKEADFSVAYRLQTEFGPVSRNANGAFVFIAYLLQGGLIALSFFALLQIGVHVFGLALFDSLPWSRTRKLKLKLHITDGLKEFGLSEVNRAINTVYVFVALGMLAPVISTASQPAGETDHGQILLRVLLPLILAVPLIVPIVDRCLRLPEASDRAHNASPDIQKSFTEQRLWPFVNTQMSYIGVTAFGIAMAEYVYVLKDWAVLLKKILPGLK